MSDPEIRHDLQIKFGSRYGAEEEQVLLEVLRRGAPTLGAEVDFVDIDPETCNLDPARLEERITGNTRAVIPVQIHPEAFGNRGFCRGQYPVTEAVSERLVTLPLNPRQIPEALDYLIESIRCLAGGRSAGQRA